MDPFMKRAVQLAIDNVDEGGQPFGAVLVKDGKIVAEGVNELHTTYDISGHAELIAIRKAQADKETHDLSDYTMYASGEPCPMCLTAMYFSGIKEAYYCASIEEAKKAGLGLSAHIYDDLKKSRHERTLSMTQIKLEKGIDDPMIIWKERDKDD